jgi:hypothetical protein
MSIRQSSSGLVQYSSSPRPSLNRQNGLRKLGVSEDDVFLAERLLEQISSCSISKSERILGYAANRMKREKAIRLLGATEDEVAVEIPKVLGALGVAGRRRSYSTTDASPPAFVRVGGRSSSHPRAAQQRRSGAAFDPKTRRPPSGGGDPRPSRRRSESDMRRLRNKAKSSTYEIEALRARMALLEERLAMVEGSKKSSDGPSPATNGTTAIPALIDNCDTQSNT